MAEHAADRDEEGTDSPIVIEVEQPASSGETVLYFQCLYVYLISSYERLISVEPVRRRSV